MYGDEDYYDEEEAADFDTEEAEAAYHQALQMQAAGLNPNMMLNQQDAQIIRAE